MYLIDFLFETTACALGYDSDYIIAQNYNILLMLMILCLLN